MLWTASKIKGFAIAASDGNIGTVSDLLFDDDSWQIRWLVVETGNWLSGRKVLLPVSTLGHPNADRREFSAKLTKQQVKDSPDVDTERPVSRQMETNIYTHYGWYPYWGYGLYSGGYAYGGIMSAPLVGSTSNMRPEEEEALAAERNRNDPHLRSVDAVEGYHIRATDGEIGHVDDVLVEEVDWSIRYFVVDTKNWWPGKKVLISPRSVEQIEWRDRVVDIDVVRGTVKSSPAYDASTAVDRDYENRFNDHYGGAVPSTNANHPSASA